MTKEQDAALAYAAGILRTIAATETSRITGEHLLYAAGRLDKFREQDMADRYRAAAYDREQEHGGTRAAAYERQQGGGEHG